MRQEVGRLKEAGAIKEIFFPEWLANTVVVRKKNGKWRVSVDFMDLNRACPKDPFPMPKIDQLVDATYGHPRMSFLDLSGLSSYCPSYQGSGEDGVHLP